MVRMGRLEGIPIGVTLGAAALDAALATCFHGDVVVNHFVEELEDKGHYFLSKQEVVSQLHNEQQSFCSFLLPPVRWIWDWQARQS